MENEENKNEENNLEEQNKSSEKDEKTLLKEKKEENNVSDDSEKKDSENERGNENKPLGEEETEKIEGNDNPLTGGDEEEGEGDDLGFDFEDLDDIPEGEDLFDEDVDINEDEDEDEEPKKKVEEVARTSERSAELLRKATLKGLGKVDVIKAKVCQKISGDHFAEYLGDEETIELFVEAFKVWAAEKEVSEPSPFVTMLLMLGMWTLPPLGMAFLSRFDVLDFFDKKEVPSPRKKETSKNFNEENKAEGEGISDNPPKYAHLKEFEQQRKKFAVNASGKYNHTPNGKTYIAVEHANEVPSDIVKEWIKEGKNNREIIKMLDYG